MPSWIHSAAVNYYHEYQSKSSATSIQKKALGKAIGEPVKNVANTLAYNVKRGFLERTNDKRSYQSTITETGRLYVQRGFKKG